MLNIYANLKNTVWQFHVVKVESFPTDCTISYTHLCLSYLYWFSAVWGKTSKLTDWILVQLWKWRSSRMTDSSISGVIKNLWMWSLIPVGTEVTLETLKRSHYSSTPHGTYLEQSCSICSLTPTVLQLCQHDGLCTLWSFSFCFKKRCWKRKNGWVSIFTLLS